MRDNESRILLVDDSRPFLALLVHHLRQGGYRELVTAASAREALRQLGIGEAAGEPAAPVDLILLDIVMPEMDGIEVCRRIKENERFRDVPIVMITGVDETEALEQAFAAGAIDYILKPMRPIELLARVRSILNLKAEIDRRKARERELLEATRQLELANRELQSLSHIDSLTGVGNRRYFNELIQDEWRRARRELTPVALVMIDIDDFKGFNDAHGHQRGDECLRQVAQALNTVLKRAGDIVVRYGGEEFAAVLPNTDLPGATSVAEELRQAVAALGIRHDASQAGGLLTLSMGVATAVPEEGSQAYGLIAAADQALYAAKNSGRDRIIVAGSSGGGAAAEPARPPQF